MNGKKTDIMVFGDHHQKIALSYRLNKNQNKIYDIKTLIDNNFKNIQTIKLHYHILQDHLSHANKNIKKDVELIQGYIQSNDPSQYIQYLIDQSIQKLRLYIQSFYRPIGELHYSKKENIIVFRLSQNAHKTISNRTPKSIKKWPYNTHNRDIFSDLITFIESNPQKFIDFKNYPHPLIESGYDFTLEEKTIAPSVKSSLKFTIKDPHLYCRTKICNGREIANYYHIDDNNMTLKILQSIEKEVMRRDNITAHEKIDILEKTHQTQYEQIHNIIKDMRSHYDFEILQECHKKFIEN